MAACNPGGATATCGTWGAVVGIVDGKLAGAEIAGFCAHAAAAHTSTTAPQSILPSDWNIMSGNSSGAKTSKIVAGRPQCKIGPGGLLRFGRCRSAFPVPFCQ